MAFLEYLSSKAWVPGWLRYRLQETSLKPLLIAELDKADSLLATVQKRLPRCSTKYSRKQLGRSMGDVLRRRAELQAASDRQSLAKYGRKRFDARSKALRTALETTRNAYTLDLDHEGELFALGADRDNLAREAAPLLIDAANTDFRRQDERFRQKLIEFERCQKIEEINIRLKAMHEAVASLEKIVTRSKRLQEGIPKAAAAFDTLDRRTIAADPRSDEVYVQTARLLEMLGNRGQRGEVVRSIGLLDQVERNLHMLAQHSDHVRRDAAQEVELWWRVAKICPQAISSFARELADIPSEPSGNSLAEWMQLRFSIAKAVSRAAKETRFANAQALDEPALRYHLFDRDEQHLYNFASESYRQWQEAVELSSSAGSLS